VKAPIPKCQRCAIYTRSLADFAKLVELFDEYEVSFVSVTQSFNRRVRWAV